MPSLNYDKTKDRYKKGKRSVDDESDKEFYTGGEVKEGDPYASNTTILDNITGS